jgi:uncharacterized membrane protein
MEKTREGANSRSVSAQPAGSAVQIRRIPFDRPWDWLAAGWRDLWRVPSLSLLYGAIATALGLCLVGGLTVFQLESLVPVLAGGFLLIGPLLAVGLYEKSRILEAGGAPTLGGSIRAARESAWRLGLLTALLLFLYLVWLRIAFMLLALFLGTRGLPPAREFLPELLFTPHGLGLLVTGTAVGALLAVVGYAATAISIPMLMDRDVDTFTAIVKSAEAVLTNPKPMLLWAALIAGFVALGIATFGAGLVIAFPLLGHATWHAYRDLVSAV